MDEWLVKVAFGEHDILLMPGGRWVPSDDEMTLLASMANVISVPPFYEYSPAHGAFGPRLAALVAEKLGGRTVFREIEEVLEPPDDVIF